MNELPASRRRLTNDAFAVLVALSAGEQVAGKIQSQVVGDSVGLYIRPSSVYAILHRFVEVGLATEQDKHYKLTDKGWKRLEVETRTMNSLVTQSKKRIVSSGRGHW